MSRFDLDYMQAEIAVLKEHNDELREQIGEWIECAEKLHGVVCYFAPDLMNEPNGFAAEKEAVAEFRRLREGAL